MAPCSSSVTFRPIRFYTYTVHASFSRTNPFAAREKGRAPRPPSQPAAPPGRRITLVSPLCALPLSLSRACLAPLPPPALSPLSLCSWSLVVPRFTALCLVLLSLLPLSARFLLACLHRHFRIPCRWSWFRPPPASLLAFIVYTYGSVCVLLRALARLPARPHRSARPLNVLRGSCCCVVLAIAWPSLTFTASLPIRPPLLSRPS